MRLASASVFAAGLAVYAAAYVAVYGYLCDGYPRTGVEHDVRAVTACFYAADAVIGFAAVVYLLSWPLGLVARTRTRTPKG